MNGQTDIELRYLSTEILSVASKKAIIINDEPDTACLN